MKGRMEELAALGMDNIETGASLHEKMGSIYDRWIASGQQASSYNTQMRRAIANGKDRIAALSKGLRTVMDHLASRDSD